MSTPRIDDTLLQRFLDEDLDAEERSQVLAILEESTADQGRVLALERLGEFVNDVTAADAELMSDADSSRMFEAILMATDDALGLDSAAANSETDATPSTSEASADAPVARVLHSTGDAADAPKRPKLRLIEGEGLGTLPPRTEKVAFEPKLSPDALADQKRAAETRESDSGAKWPGLIAVVALAAAAVLALALRPNEGGPPAPVAEVVAPSVPENQELVIEDEPEVLVATHQGSEVEEIDFGSNMGTVFQVLGEQDVPVAVVWISDEEYVR
jgi:hypothetical protein